jgi:DNA-binding transcriptional regulator YiaG
MKPLKLEEITTEKLIEIEQEVQNVRMHDLTMRQLEELSDQKQIAEMALSDIERECKIRCMRAHQLGFTKAELARIFKVTSNTITKWIG